MHQPLILSLVAAIALTGCSAFRKSQTWQDVVDQRHDRVASGNSKAGYPDRIHAVLAARNVEHRIVTYQYRYQTRLREEAVGTGRMVLYRDAHTAESPWWVADESAAYPVWVPNGPVDRQVSFFLRHRAEVIEQQEFPAGDGKSLAPASSDPMSPDAALLAKARRPAPKLIARAQPRPAAPEPIAAGPDGRSEWLASMERNFDALFRARHGSAFDPRSSTDRQKMAQLRQLLSARRAQL